MHSNSFFATPLLGKNPKLQTRNVKEAKKKNTAPAKDFEDNPQILWQTL